MRKGSEWEGRKKGRGMEEKEGEIIKGGKKCIY